MQRKTGCGIQVMLCIIFLAAILFQGVYIVFSTNALLMYYLNINNRWHLHDILLQWKLSIPITLNALIFHFIKLTVTFSSRAIYSQDLFTLYSHDRVFICLSVCKRATAVFPCAGSSILSLRVSSSSHRCAQHPPL